MRKGFTLIELLLVVVIIGILAALVLPKFGDIKQKAYKAAMQSDLRNFATAQEIYFSDYGVYAAQGSTATSTPSASNAAGFTTSDHVTITVDSTAADMYKASATNSLSTTGGCSITMGVNQNNKVTCP